MLVSSLFSGRGMILTPEGLDVSVLLAALWCRADVPPLKNKETVDSFVTDDEDALVTMWSVEKCPIESCKTWSRAKCWSLESENHCVAYAKNHFVNQAVPNHKLGDTQSDDLGEALTVKKDRYTRKELAKWWGKPDAPKQNKRKLEEEEEGAAVATNAAGAASSAASWKLEEEEEGAAVATNAAGAASSAASWWRNEEGAASSAAHLRPRREVLEICERSISAAVSRADAAIKEAGRQCVAASAQLQFEAGKIQESLDRLQQSLESDDDDCYFGWTA